MRPSRVARGALLLVLLAPGACGRLRYDLLDVDAGAGGAPGGSGGSVGAGGTGASDAGRDAPEGGGPTDGGGAIESGGFSDALDGAGITCAMQTFGGHDYLFCDALVDWSTARAACEARGMRLVRIDDAAENSWLLANAISASMARRENLWIGGYEPTTDGDWHWTDGAAFWLGGSNGMAVGGLYANWDSREPNNAVGQESCTAIPLNGTTWFDYQCSFGCYFACEAY